MKAEVVVVAVVTLSMCVCVPGDPKMKEFWLISVCFDRGGSCEHGVCVWGYVNVPVWAREHKMWVCTCSWW